MKKVLILTASFGEGHNTAARSIREAIEFLDQEAVVEVLDLFASSYGRLHNLVRTMHLQIVQRAPRIWAELYHWLDTAPSLDGKLGVMSKLKASLEDIVEEHQPDCVVSTYPLYAHLIRDLYKDHAERPFRLVTVVTDSISVNSMWFRAPSDLFCVPNELTGAVLRQGGVPESMIKSPGFPVNPLFADEELPEIDPPREGAPFKVLYIVNSGKRKAGSLVDRLLELPNVELTITVGKDPELKAEMLKLTDDHSARAKVLGWTNQMPELMRSHHLAISKAGGATVQETIAARCPMIVNQILPGQEEGNAELITRLEIGAVASESKEVVRLVEKAMAHEAKLWHEWRRNLVEASRPDAAFRIAEMVLDLADNTEASSANGRLFKARPGQNGKTAPRRVNLNGRESRMLLCDFHIHSNYSDGVLTVPELVDFYGKLDFDCICITDHLADPGRLMGKLARMTNFTLSPLQIEEYFGVIERERKRAWRRYGMLVMTGIEFNKDGLTKKSSAHLLGIDLKAPIEARLDLPETISAIREQGGLAIASHPHIMKSEWGKNTLYLWLNQETYAPMIDAWEIANRNNIFTPVGLKHLPFIANSDFHKPKHIYSWKTLLHCEKDPEAIKQCVRTNKQVAITLFRKEHNPFAEERVFSEPEEKSFLLPQVPVLATR